MGYHTARAAVILAWGREEDSLPRRFFQPGGDSSLLEYVLDAVWTVADEMFVVFRHEPSLKLIEAVSPFGVKIVIEGKQPTLISSATTGFRVSRSEYCLLIRENIPFLKPSVLHALFDSAQGYEAVIPRWLNGTTEPLLAVFRRKSFLNVATNKQQSDDIAEIIDGLYSVRYLDIESETKMLDPELESFFKVNSEDDLLKAREMASMKSR